jgi:hypothetical protein
MSQSMTAADYIAMIVVIVPCLFLMCLLPLFVDLRQERQSRQHTAADRRLPQPDDHATRVQLVPAITGNPVHRVDPLNGVTEPVLVPGGTWRGV